MTSQTSGSKIEWFLARDGRQHGPLADAEMTKFLELGHLRPGDLVWRAGFAEWRAAATVFDLGKAPPTAPLITGRPTEPVTQPPPAAGPSAPAAASVVEVKSSTPAATTTPMATLNRTADAPSDDAAADGVKTGIGAKKPLDTPLLTPTQLPTPVRVVVAPEIALDDSENLAAASPITSLNQRLQRAASDRAAAVPTQPTQPLHSHWPQTLGPQPPAPSKPDPIVTSPGAATSVIVPAATPAAPRQPAPAKLAPLRDVRPTAPVPLMPLEPRTGPAALGAAPTRQAAQPHLLPPPDSHVVRNRARSLGVGLTLAIIIGGGGWLAYTSGGAVTTSVTRPSISIATGDSTAGGSMAGSTAAPAAPPQVVAAPSATRPPTTEGVGKFAPFVTTATTTETVDAELKRSAVWQLIAREFPEWHRDRVSEIAKLTADKRDGAAVSRHIAEAIVSLRRKFADQALSASPEQLRAVAVAFLENLRQLASHSTDACYGFISQGETYPAVVDLMRQGDRTDALHKQAVAVFEAVAAGRKSPQTNLPPRKTDYDTLATELTARGWSQADLQMFSDAKALAAAPPERVCTMVQDWFAAQITIKDPAIQLRLLVESLRPVVAG